MITKTVGASYLTNRAGLGNLANSSPGQPLVALFQTEEQTTSRAAHDGWAYRTYVTSLDLDESGVPSPTLIAGPGEQRLMIRPENPLILFNIVASVEWNATDDYLDDLADAFRKASDYLCDVTDGQMTFGQVTIYDNAENWSKADYQFSTKNTVQPYAFLGGITSSDEAHTIWVGRFWDGGSGNSGAWSEPNGYRTLIHEFGHYALHLQDEYFLRLVDADGNLIGQSNGMACTSPAIKDNSNEDTNASIMYYQYNATELSDKSYNWDGQCLATEQCRLNHNESDWETVLRHYGGPGWTINTPGSRGEIMAGPTHFPTALLPFPDIRVYNSGVARGDSLAITVTNPQSQPVPNALVALYTQDKSGVNIAIDQGLAKQDGAIDVYGARPEDTIKAATFDGALAGGIRVATGTTRYALTLNPTNISGLGPVSPYLTLVPGSDGDSLTLSVQRALAGTLPLDAVVVPDEGAGSPQFASLVNTPGADSYDGSVSFAGVGLGTGRIRISGLAGGQVVAINSDYNLQAVRAITTNHLYSQDGNFELHIPANGLAANGYSTVIPTGHVPLPLPSGQQVIGSAYEVRLSGAVTTLEKEGLVRLHYHPEVMGVYSNTAIYYWTAGSNTWQHRGGEPNDIDNAWTITATRLGIYALMGETVDGDSSVYLPLIVKE